MFEEVTCLSVDLERPAIIEPIDIEPVHTTIALQPLTDDYSRGFVDSIGYDALDVGPLAEGWRFERDTAAYVQPYAVPGTSYHTRSARPSTAELSKGPTELAEHRGARVNMAEHRDFHYQAAAVEVPVPRIGGRPMPPGDDMYYKVEVFTQTGSEGYDLVGLTPQQVVNDVLDRYETHLSFLRYSTEHDYASVITPVIPPAPVATPPVPTVADDVERVED